MDIVYSDHARRRMKQRGIADFEVEYVLSHPDYEKPALDGKTEVGGRAQHRPVRIIFIEKEKYIKIITII